MEDYYEDFEIVRVLNATWLIDAESYQRAYWRPPGAALQPGYYVVSWPPEVERKRFDDKAEFRGPLVGMCDAVAMRDLLSREARQRQAKAAKKVELAS
ncbi:MAG TPA: hypothetical protein VMU33_14450 [Burkholderiaceae bacterium]|nr:hypothetical protein [Burkholderiaceae bacterium]